MITIDSLKTHIYEGVMDAISDQDDTLVQSAIDAAVSEAKGYCSRYNADMLFAGHPDDAALKMHLKSMAKWHFIVLCNPNVDYEDARTRYEQAISWLRAVQSGKVVPPGWPPLLTPPGRDTFFHAKSSTRKRRNHI